jgi:hypothetical protein
MSTPHLTEATAPDLSGWARRVLGDAVDGAPGRAAVLRGLAGHEFVPPPAWQEAFEVACRPTRGGAPLQGVQDEEKRLRAVVDAFAATFFHLTPPARRGRWQALQAKCRPFPRLAARLEALQPGLEADPAGLSDRDSQVRWLAEQAAALFVLRPPDRAVRRQQLLAGLGARGPRLEAAAIRLQKRSPALAALEPDLVGRLASWSKTQKALGKAFNPKPARAERTTSGSAAGALGWVAVMLVSMCFRGLSSRSPNYELPHYQSAPIPTRPRYEPTADPLLKFLNSPTGDWPGPPMNQPRKPWEPLVPQRRTDPFQALQEGVPVQQPGESVDAYQRRLTDWHRRLTDPLGGQGLPGMDTRRPGQVPGVPQTPDWGLPQLPTRAPGALPARRPSSPPTGRRPPGLP